MSRLNLLIFAASFGLTAGHGAPQEPITAAPRPPRAAASANVPAPPAPPTVAWPDGLPLPPLPPTPPMVPALESHVFATVPPAATHQGDPADSLYKAAREQLNGGEYGRAAELFAQIAARYPKSAYAKDALYWQAFALYRRGGRGELRAARAALQDQKQRYPDAATSGDADALMARINGELAREGDSDAAEAVAAQAAAIAQAAVASIDVGKLTAEATRAGVEAARVGTEQARAAMEQARAAMEATAAAMPGVMGRIRASALPQECQAQREKLDMQVAALNALMQMDADQAMPVLRDILKRRDVCSAQLRRQAVFMVAQKHTAETEDILLDLVRNDPDPGVREQAVFWLSQVHTEKAQAALENVLTTASDPKLQERALFALSQQRTPGAMEALRKYAQDESKPAELREKAIFWLGQEHSPANDEFLQQLFRRSTSQAQKERILFSLGQAHSASNDRFMAGVATDASQPMELRKRALFWASQSGSIGAAELGKFYDSSDAQMKEQIIFSLSQRHDGIDKLLDIARNEKDPKLRSKAIFWLGQSRDPRAVKLLQEIVSQ